MQSSTVGPTDDAISEEYAAVHDQTPASAPIGTTGASASAGANANITSNKDSMNTQSGANDVSNDSSDGIDEEMETMNREMERYIPRPHRFNPIARNPARSQGSAANNTNRPSTAPKSCPPAVTANAGTTAQPKRKS